MEPEQNPEGSHFFSHSLQTIAPSKQRCDQVTTWVMFLRQTSEENLSQSPEHHHVKGTQFKTFSLVQSQ